MALASVKTTRKKVKRARSTKFADTKYLGEEPEWIDAEKWDANQIRRHKAFGLTWYNYFYSPPELKTNLYEWMKEAKYTENDIKAVKAFPDGKLTNPAVANATMLINGMPNTESGWLRDKVAEMIVEGKTIKPVKKVVEKNKDIPQPTIQDRMREQLSNIIAEFEEWEDNVVLDAKYTAPDISGWLKVNTVAQAHIKKIMEYYAPRLEEVRAASAKDADEDLKEAYSEFNTADFNHVITFYEDMIAGLEVYAKFKKVNRSTRTKKVPTAQKLVAKMKYRKEDMDLKLVSIKPSDIVGATALWVYNTKTRKIGCYKVDPTAGQLSVKGTTIIGFDEKESVAKTVRKPADQLKAFNKAGKVALRTYLDDIKAVSIKLTGRINNDTILLKTY